jgi:hypothetical protein
MSREQFAEWLGVIAVMLMTVVWTILVVGIFGQLLELAGLI